MQADSRKRRFKKRPDELNEQIELNLHVVNKLARRIAMRSPANIKAEDLIGAGTLGLMDSVVRNNGQEGISFACYMRTRIRGAIQDELRAMDWLPRRARSIDTKATTRGAPRPVAVVGFNDLPPGPERQPAAKEDGSNPMESAQRNAVNAALKNAISNLHERERLVLNLHYFNDMRLKEIGRLLGVSEARVSQIHHRALAKLKPMMRNAA